MKTLMILTALALVGCGDTSETTVETTTSTTTESTTTVVAVGLDPFSDEAYVVRLTPECVLWGYVDDLDSVEPVPSWQLPGCDDLDSLEYEPGVRELVTLVDIDPTSFDDTDIDLDMVVAP